MAFVQALKVQLKFVYLEHRYSIDDLETINRVLKCIIYMYACTESVIEDLKTNF